MKIIIYISFFSLVFLQEWKPLHPIELENHRDVFTQFEHIDSIALVYPNTVNINRNISHEVIGYLPYWEYDSYPHLDYELLSQINYFSAELNADGSIANSHNWVNLGMIAFAQERGVYVKLCATMFGASSLTTLLSNPAHRQNAINNLLLLVLEAGADGIDIDFELLPASQRDNLVLFIQELRVAFQASLSQYIITMATPAVDWSNAWDYETLAEITDGLFIMGYNYFYSGSATAGPVSPLNGYSYDLTSTVNSYLTETNGQNDKIILGLPYYGYDWPVENNQIFSVTTGSGSALFYNSAQSLSQNYGYLFDTSTTAPWLTYQSGGWRQCWYDDSLSLSLKYQFAVEQNLAGVGIWALGYDEGHDELWDALFNQFYIISGDLNDDNIVDILDIIISINLILSNEFNQTADMNEDGIINILDVVILVNIILDRIE